MNAIRTVPNITRSEQITGKDGYLIFWVSAGDDETRDAIYEIEMETMRKYGSEFTPRLHVFEED